jgi:hypothetical protein
MGFKSSYAARSCAAHIYEDHMRTALLLLAALAASFAVRAQALTYEAVRLSEAFLEATWATQEQAKPIIISGLEAHLRQSGASDKVSTVFSRELAKALNRDNVGKAVAAFLSQALTVEETRDLSAFLQSSLGRKYLALSRDMSTNATYLGQLVKPACEATRLELSASERRSIEAVCGR